MAATGRDSYWMGHALALARKGLGLTQPNPLVGCVVLDAGRKLTGRGFHHRAGEDHAEVIALTEAAEKARGGTLYVTLEPCTHVGRTPPCINPILESGVSRVVIATVDQNPIVRNKGIGRLRAAGITVDVGCRESQARAMNLPFFTWITHKRPLVTVKVAVSLDGKIGVAGQRLRLTGRVADHVTMRLRAEAGAILVGANTVISDDPLLTVRGRYRGRRPVRAIVDGNLRTPPTAGMFSEEGGPIRIFCRESTLKSEDGHKRSSALRLRGAEVVPIATRNQDPIDIGAIVQVLGDIGVTAILVEGGSELISHFIRENQIDRWILFVSPTFLGSQKEGKETIPLLREGPFSLKFHSVIRRGADWEAIVLSEEIRQFL
ncbi:MAG TPA: bifunctional diaminohydroxyphosphoribosylaminopyrimidine deaminase/5-amino-6-(5-phosphoribosylamino)uracil reductase RibD [Bdellovibrionota bacterium]|nr:bifunctional diaminohydroxyphosphoribosylaminopyrimidine deaminase/5-amino-6-(5-phosphoribosylamino)uracil reductase RibD [Bdellovibrionota bacterium]